jgi:hypothetical protein
MALTGLLRMAEGGMAMAQPRKTNQGVHPNSTNQWRQTNNVHPNQTSYQLQVMQQGKNYLVNFNIVLPQQKIIPKEL